MAYRWFVDFSLHRITFPKVPLPSTLRKSKSLSACKQNKAITEVKDQTVCALEVMLSGVDKYSFLLYILKKKKTTHKNMRIYLRRQTSLENF